MPKNPIYELKNQRAEKLVQAREALDKKNTDGYAALMRDIESLNAEIDNYEKLDAEAGRFDERDERMVRMSDALAERRRDDIARDAVDAMRSTNEYHRAFFDALANGVSVKAALKDAQYRPLLDALSSTGGTPEGANGGFLIPKDFDDMIYEEQRQFVQLSSLFATENVTLPTGWRAFDVKPNKGFTEVNEMGTIPKDDSPTFRKVEYSIHTYAGILPCPHQLLADNTANLAAYLTRWVARKAVITENTLLMALLDTLTASNLKVGDEVSAIKSVLNKDLDPMISANAAIITNQSGYDYLDQLKATDGRPLLQPDPTTGTPMLLKSHRIIMLSDAQLPNRTVTTTGATKGEYYPVYIGNFDVYGTLFRRQATEIASTDIGGSAWDTYSTEIRAVQRLDAQSMDTGAAVKREIFIAASAS